MQNYNVDYVEFYYICDVFNQNSINLNFIIMEKRVFKSVPIVESFGTAWHNYAVVCASLNELLRFFSLSISSVKRHSLTDKTRYVLCIKTDGLPCFTLYDRCIFAYGRKFDNELDTVIDWHLGTFNSDVAFRTCKCLRTFGLKVDVNFFVEDDLPF